MATGGTVTFNFKGDDSDLDKKTRAIDDKIKSLGKSIGSAFLKGATVASAAMTAVVGTSIKAYADMEQNIGGVETLFKNSADTVIANAKKAYETAGLSANQYMETVTSFSASLLQSLGGDTVKAAEVADMAIVDMSDNANKMGTSMEMIQNAYQGFAKQNYTMLDNLKLGYGGTKEEMERLLVDAEKISGIKYDISSFSDITEAIHVMQVEMGISGISAQEAAEAVASGAMTEEEAFNALGTTAKEATETISGSINSAKGAIANFLSGSGSIDDVITTVTTAITNVSKALTTMAPKIVDGLVGLVNGLLPQIPSLIQGLMPTIVDGIIGLANGVIAVLPQVMSMLSGMLPQILQSLINGLIQIVTSVADMLPSLIPMVVEAIVGLIPVLLSNLPLFINAGIQMTIGLMNGLLNAIPVLVDSLPQIIESLITGLMGALPQLIFMGPTLILGLVKGLLSAIFSLHTTGPKIIKGIVDGLMSGFPEMLKVGGDLIKGLWQGISDVTGWITNKIKGFGKSVLSAIKGIFGIHSPSKEFAFIGKMNVLGLEQGMEDMKGELNTTFDDMMNLSPTLSASASNVYNPNVNVVVNNSFEQDPLGQMVQTQKNFSGGSKNDYNFGLGV